MEILGLGLLGLSLLYVAAWREGWQGWLAAMAVAVIALVGGLFAVAAAGLMGIGIGAAVVIGQDISEAERQQLVLAVGGVVGAVVGILPLASRTRRSIARTYVAGLAAGGVQSSDRSVPAAPRAAGKPNGSGLARHRSGHQAPTTPSSTVAQRPRR